MQWHCFKPLSEQCYLSVTVIISCIQLELLRGTTNLCFFCFVTAKRLHFLSLSTAAPYPHLGISQVGPVTFSKFGARCNKRKMFHQSRRRCTESRDGARHRNGGINHRRLCQQPFPGWDDGKTSPCSLGTSFVNTFVSSKAQSFRAEPRRSGGVFWAFLKWNPPLPALPVGSDKVCLLRLKCVNEGGEDQW